MSQDRVAQAIVRAGTMAPPIPPAAAERAAKTLARLDEAFRSVRHRIPVEELMWDGADVGPWDDDEPAVEDELPTEPQSNAP